MSKLAQVFRGPRKALFRLTVIVLATLGFAQPARPSDLITSRIDLLRQNNHARHVVGPGSNAAAAADEPSQWGNWNNWNNWRNWANWGNWGNWGNWPNH